MRFAFAPGFLYKRSFLCGGAAWTQANRGDGARAPNTARRIEDSTAANACYNKKTCFRLPENGKDTSAKE